ncbi:P27 family phage terminase small subunit [Corynebacterium macclintockiae]|uniref:P27 family phage terminase small subunit n=1 Tax=Corynebacterium macclintockiae TaxID=2913501 RepID=UPI003EC09CF3
MSHSELVKALAGDRELSEFDSRAVTIVAQLIERVQEAREIIAAEGAVVDKGSGEPIEHPAVKVERMASAEIRGWVKERPDLFGARPANAGHVSGANVDKFGGFKLVK